MLLPSKPFSNQATEPERALPCSHLIRCSAAASISRATFIEGVATELFGLGSTVTSPTSDALLSDTVDALIVTYSRLNQVRLPKAQAPVKDDCTTSDRPRYPAPLWKGSIPKSPLRPQIPQTQLSTFTTHQRPLDVPQGDKIAHSPTETSTGTPAVSVISQCPMLPQEPCGWFVSHSFRHRKTHFISRI